MEIKEKGRSIMEWPIVCLFLSCLYAAYVQETINKHLRARIEQLEEKLGLR